MRRDRRIAWSVYGRLLLRACLSASLMSISCAREKDAAAAPQETASASAFVPGAMDPASVGTDPNPPAIDGNRVMQYTKEIVAFGPRPIGSANHKKVEEYIVSHLKGDSVEDDFFTADTPAGKFPGRNIIAKFPGPRDGIIVIASHYDTNYPLRNTSFVGANDGASSSALLLEFANQLRGKKLEGYSVWLLWDDAEEAVKDWGSALQPAHYGGWAGFDNLYGVRHLAEKWEKDGTIKKIRAFLLEDMIGDADLNVDEDSDSTPWLESVVYQAATRLGYQSHFFARTLAMEDDHLPFMQRGVPCADLIDFSYGYNNIFWHTPQDTVDKLSPKSLEIVGEVTLETVKIVDARK